MGVIWRGVSTEGPMWYMIKIEMGRNEEHKRRGRRTEGYQGGGERRDGDRTSEVGDGSWTSPAMWVALGA